jgi:hypothetical protein
MSKVRRYAIEVTDVETDQIVLLAAVDWTEEKKRKALAQLLRLVRRPDGSTPPEPQRRGKA